MLDFSNLTPLQVSVIIGILASLIQVSLVKGLLFRIKDWSDHHKEIINVVLSVVLPAIITLGAYLASNTTFTGLFPHYAESYLAAQAFYYTAVRFTAMVTRWYKVASTLQSSTVTTVEQTI